MTYDRTLSDDMSWIIWSCSAIRVASLVPVVIMKSSDKILVVVILYIKRLRNKHVYKYDDANAGGASTVMFAVEVLSVCAREQ